MSDGKTVFFSVIIPNYNTELYIEKCLDALARQSFKDFEVVITDDCSTDSSVSVIQKYVNKGSLDIRLIINNTNMGPSKSREKAIRIAKGEYVAFCDSDDWYDDDYLELAYKAIEKSGCDICFCGYKTVLEKNGKTSINEHFLSCDLDTSDKKQVLAINVDSMCTMIINNQLFLDISFPDIRNGEDMALIPVLISNSNTFDAVYNCPYNYYYREGSASLSPNLNVVKSLVSSYEYIYAHIRNSYPNECEYLGIRNLLYGGILNLIKCSSDISLANKIIDEFEEKYPNWCNNSYKKNLPKYKKCFLFAVRHRNFLILRILAHIHTVVTR